jgi:integrase
MSQLHSGGYFWERQIKGQKHREGLGRSEDIAIEKATRLNRDVERGEYEPHAGSNAAVTLARFVEESLKAKAHLAKKTRADYEARGRLLLRYIQERHPRVTRLAELTPQIAAGYPEWRAQQDTTRCGWRTETTPLIKPQPNTIRDEIGRFRTLMKHAVRQGWIASDPFAAVDVPRKRGERLDAHNPLSDEEVGRLLDAARRYDRSEPHNGVHSTFRGHVEDMTALFLYTGLRKQELIFLPWEHVRFDWGKHGIIDVQPFEIVVPLNIRLEADRLKKAARLIGDREPSEPLFANRRSFVPLSQPITALSSQRTGYLRSMI